VTNTRSLPSRLLVITDRHQARHPIEAIAEAVGAAGGRWLCLRDKDLEPEVRAQLAARVAQIARRSGIHLSIGGDVELAADLGASVHLPGTAAAEVAAVVSAARQRLGPAAMIGVSAHSRGDVAAAAAAGADYVTLSPIFLTGSKPGYGPALGVAAIRDAVTAGIPILALGGITAANAGLCLAAGAGGVAVMGGIMRADDPADVVAALLATCSPTTAAH
jgi:thiamine-phosphate pyrophosphorylase